MARWRNTRRFDLVELCLVVAVSVIAMKVLVTSRYAGVFYVALNAAQEGEHLKNRYGPSRFSEHEEEWFIRDYFQDRRDGVFVDVGANHYQGFSNTYYLESVLGWTGIAIDPPVQFATGYREHRPRTRFFSFFISDASDASATLYEVDQNPLVASANQRCAERAGTQAQKPLYETHAVTVPTIRVTDLLDRAGVSRLDCLSVDVGLAEPKMLAGFDINRFKPALVRIEAYPQVRQQILNYFADHGYVVLGRYLRAEQQNLYFAPLDGTPVR